MSFAVSCPCGYTFATAEANAGRLARCPDCGRDLIVPSPGSDPEILIISDEPARGTTSGLAVASFTLGILFIFGCLSGIPAIILGILGLRRINRSGGRLLGRKRAIAGIVLGGFACLLTVALLMPATRSARESARRSQCMSNLGDIGLALHNYHEANGRLPPAAITDKDGKPLLSWRVALLPYLERTELHAKFRLDEPWDSPHNIALVESRPSVYGCPSDHEMGRGMTGYQAVIGPNTIFPPDFHPIRWEDLTDGVSQTLLVGETRQVVPWTKPEDLAFDTPLSLHGLGSHHGYHRNGFHVLLGDGRVKFLKASIEPDLVDRLLTRNGGD